MVTVAAQRRMNGGLSDAEIDRKADAMDAFAQRYVDALDRLSPDPRGAAYTHGNALVAAERGDDE